MKKMRKRVNFPFIGGVAVIALWIGMTLPYIGRMPNASGPYSWDVTLMLAIVTVPPFVLGYFAGKR